MTQLLTAHEASKRAGVSIDAINVLTLAGVLPAQRAGKRFVFAESDVRAVASKLNDARKRYAAA